MNILMYGWEFPPNISGGLGVACAGIVHGLLAKKLNLTLVLPKDKNQEDFIISSSDFFKTLYINSILTPYMSHATYREALQNHDQGEKNVAFGSDLVSEVKQYASKAGAIAEKVPHDLIHVHDWLTVLAGLEAKKTSKKPLVFHVHALEIDRCFEHPNAVIFEIEKEGLKKSDKIIAVSHYTKNLIVEKYGIDPNKIAVVHNGLTQTPKTHLPYQPHYSSKMKVILFLGRITSQKGPYFFIETAHKILRQRKDVCFVMAGDGDLLRSMIEQVAKLRIGKYFHFTGFLDRIAVEKIYQHSQVYVMPSLSEPFGISCLEALSHNVPTIISTRSGAAEVLQHVIKVDFWDTHEMASKILAILDYAPLGKEMLTNSKKDLQKLNWHNSAQKICEVYKKVIGL